MAESSDDESSLRAPKNPESSLESSRTQARTPSPENTQTLTPTYIDPHVHTPTHISTHVPTSFHQVCPPMPGSTEPAQDCLWRVKGYNIRKMEWQSYLVRASDNVGAQAQAEFRWGKTHKYIMITDDPILALGSEYPPVRDDGGQEK